MQIWVLTLGSPAFYKIGCFPAILRYVVPSRIVLSVLSLSNAYRDISASLRNFSTSFHSFAEKNVAALCMLITVIDNGLRTI